MFWFIAGSAGLIGFVACGLHVADASAATGEVSVFSSQNLVLNPHLTLSKYTKILE